MTSVQFRSIPSGDAGTRATLAHMAALARVSSLDLLVRHAAVTILRFADGRDAYLQARMIRDWLEDHAHFIPDPYLAEALHNPVDVLTTIARSGIARVDCDDVATLAASLGLAVGLVPRFVVAAFSPNDRYSHVWTELRTQQGWLPVDPTRTTLTAPPKRMEVYSIV